MLARLRRPRNVQSWARQILNTLRKWKHQTSLVEECLLQSFSGIINISQWTVEYSEFRACLLSDLISYRRPRCKTLNQVSQKLWKPAPERILFFPIALSTCLVLCGNNLCVWHRERKKATINGVQTQLWKFQVPERTAVHASFIPLAPEPETALVSLPVSESLWGL